MTALHRSQAVQNVGSIDRLMRLLLGAVLLGWAYHSSLYGEVTPGAWVRYAYAIALYPLFTGMLGWDPLYALFNGRTCDNDGRHPCGSLPYQLRALFGRAPRYCDSEWDRSLAGCHDRPAASSRHQT